MIYGILNRGYMKLIDKSALVAEIENLENTYKKCPTRNSYEDGLKDGRLIGYKDALYEINTLEVKEVDTWHLQEKENIYDAVKDWSLYTFACIMKDGTIQKFTGNLDEDSEGHINTHIYGVNDDYDNVDDIVKWIEYT